MTQLAIFVPPGLEEERFPSQPSKRVERTSPQFLSESLSPHHSRCKEARAQRRTPAREAYRIATLETKTIPRVSMGCGRRDERLSFRAGTRAQPQTNGEAPVKYELTGASCHLRTEARGVA
jgi:hypothetical protein